MKKALFLCAIFTIFFQAQPVIAQPHYNETLTITTYYPAPYGVYRNLKLNPSREPTVGVSEGVMYYNDTDHVIKFRNDTTWVNMTGGGEVNKLSMQTIICNSGNEAAIKYNSTSRTVEFCDGSSWQTLNSTSSGPQYPPGSIVEKTGSSCPENTVIVDSFYDAQEFFTCIFQGVGYTYWVGAGWSSSSPISSQFSCGIGGSSCGTQCSKVSVSPTICECTKTNVSRVKCQY